MCRDCGPGAVVLSQLGRRLHYTGYVVGHPAPPPPTAALSREAGEVIVSVGGGAVGRQLLESAVQARPLTVLAHHPWRLLAGVNAGHDDLVRLREMARAQSGVVVERHRPDFAQLLAHCRMSISQGGYNTVMDILQARAPAVVVPFAGGAEVEQSLRAHLLAERGWLGLLDESALGPVALAQAIDQVALRPVVATLPVNLDGARNSAALVAQWIAERAT